MIPLSMRLLTTALVACLASLGLSCSDSSETAATVDASGEDAGAEADAAEDALELDAETGSEVGLPDASVPAVAPLKLADYPDGGGKYLLMTISVNGSPPIDVLLDTGSNGLRVFAEALEGTEVEVGTEALDVEFGNGEKLAGHIATSSVSFGDIATPEPIAYHLVESFECASWNPNCEFADGSGALLTDAGIHGILGVSTRAGQPASVYSPFAQLDPELRAGYVVHTGGWDANVGEVRFGVSDDDMAGFATIDLLPGGSFPSGEPAWADDRVEACFVVNGKDVEPPCTEMVFDTGSSADVIYAPNLPPAEVDYGALAPGVTFEASAAGAFETNFKVGSPQTASLDLVFVDTTMPFAILGIGAFLRNDVWIDQAGGKIGFKLL